jgi:hypothetical protein
VDAAPANRGSGAARDVRQAEAKNMRQSGGQMTDSRNAAACEVETEVFLDLPRAADLLRISQPTVKTWIERGILHGRRLNDGRREVAFSSAAHMLWVAGELSIDIHEVPRADPLLVRALTLAATQGLVSAVELAAGLSIAHAQALALLRTLEKRHIVAKGRGESYAYLGERSGCEEEG